MSIFKIAVTGSAGSGKSLVGNCFAELGLTVLDCDRIARDVVEPGKQAYIDIIYLFGDKIVNDDDSLNRLQLRKIIATDEKMRKGLEDIMHPAIFKTLFLKINKAEMAGAGVVIIEIPLLFELNMMEQFDLIITVAGRGNDLVERIVRRDSVSKEDAKAVLALQFSQKDKVEGADFVIWNTSGESAIKGLVEDLYRKIKKEYLT